MSIRPILSVSIAEARRPGIPLNSPSAPVSNTADDELLALIEDLRDTMHAYPICVGLAAPQIGVPLQVAVVNVTNSEASDDLVLINPQILTSTGKRDIKYESCMSVVGWRGQVERRKRLTVATTTLEGAIQEIEAEGFLARAIAHEIDHLNGALYVKHVKEGTLERTDLFSAYSSETGVK